MTTKKHCAELIRRCAGLDFFPSDMVVREVLVDALQRHAASDAHAERIVRQWLENERKAPMPADIVQLARDVSPDADGNVPGGCQECRGEPFVVSETDGRSGARRCSCERGRFLQAKDDERRLGRTPATGAVKA
jgi:hypothetical protein